MTNTEIIVNLATIIADQRLEISELKTEVEHLHHELLAMRVESDTPQTESTGSPIGDYRDGVGAWQTDCAWKEPNE